MAITIDWGTQVINVPQADLTFLGGTDYELDTDAFRLTLKSLEAGATGMPFLDTHRHTTETVLGGITYARFVEIINGYTVTFEDGAYSVNLVGSNNNIQDVTNLNQVSVRSQNSAGLVNKRDIQISMGVRYDRGSNSLHMAPYKKVDDIVTTPTAATLTWRPESGAALFSATYPGDFALEGDNVLTYTRTETLTSHTLYRVYVSITDTTGTHENIIEINAGQL